MSKNTTAYSGAFLATRQRHRRAPHPCSGVRKRNVSMVAFGPLMGHVAAQLLQPVGVTVAVRTPPGLRMWGENATDPYDPRCTQPVSGNTVQTLGR